MAVDWNVCIGYLVSEHAFPAADLRPSYLCPTCDDRLNNKVDNDREAARAAQHQPSSTCSGGNHAPGSHYYDCLVCYGD